MTETAVSHLLKRTLAQCQFDALVSFTFNVGAGNLASSTLLRDVNTGECDGFGGTVCSVRPCGEYGFGWAEART